ncbi:MAG: hypothetical protein ACN2B6_09080 [Rickettsiales bacterium]
MMSEADINKHLPKMTQLEDGYAPLAPSSVKATGIAKGVLLDLALKTAYVLPQFTTQDVAARMYLPQVVVAELLEQLRSEMMLEVLGHTEDKGYRFVIAQQGRERAQQLLEVSGYIGPAPVSLESYTAMFEWLDAQPHPVSSDQVKGALSELVMEDDAIEIAGMAVSSNRSLFLSGPPGNGKTSMGRCLHNVRPGEIWIPHCIAVEHNIIRLFDSHCHQPVEVKPQTTHAVDARWIKIKRPFVVAGGEMTLESLDMAYLPSLRYYEAPLHMKANGGTFLIDDFGRQHVEPSALLNRWIIPLEHRIDFLTLFGGQKIQVPFLLMLIIATNLKPEDVTDPAFLRRLGYRLHVPGPTPESYTKIFHDYASRYNLEMSQEFMDWLLARYKNENRELRACEPRDLIERARDICKYRKEDMRIDKELIELAWVAYFGNKEIKDVA